MTAIDYNNIMEVLQRIEAKLDKLDTPKMWNHNCPTMGTELMSTEVGEECNWCGKTEHEG